ncbi:MAG TPA: hypothetical protein VNM92_09710 [Thermoanaerobaculia bacterium]|nr:hypothetical protein [Thermoanaerobaculia bacterium]
MKPPALVAGHSNVRRAEGAFVVTAAGHWNVRPRNGASVTPTGHFAPLQCTATQRYEFDPAEWRS